MNIYDSLDWGALKIVEGTSRNVEMSVRVEIDLQVFLSTANSLTLMFTA